MENLFTFNFLLGLGISIFITVGFDAILHGLSHGSHSLLDFIWQDEINQRSKRTAYFGSITWHIIADVLIGIIIVLSVFTFSNKDIIVIVIITLILASMSIAQWMHIYAAFQVKGNVVLGLSILSILQISLTTIVVGAILIFL
jgi:hypothetical protein